MAQTIIVGGTGPGFVGANDAVYYQHGNVVTSAPPPYSLPTASAYPGSYGPPPGSAYPGSYGPPPGTITVAPTIIVSNELGAKPQRATCQFCQASVITRVDSRPTCKTHCCALALGLICFWPCIFIPYCSPECMGADHYCPNCNAHLGSYNY